MSNPDEMKKYTGGWQQDFLIALIFLTRLPLTLNLQFSMSAVGSASRAFALVGVVVGGISGGVFYLAAAANLPLLICAFLAIGAQILLTGALHEDAIGDVADGFGGGADKQKKMDIMRDSRVGTYAVVTLIVLIGIKASSLAALGLAFTGFAVIVSAAVCSRGLMACAMHVLPAARKDGLGASAGKPAVSAALWSLAIALIVPIAALGPFMGSAAVAAAMAGACIMGVIAQRQIGGQTGDVLGSVQQISECFFLVTMAALLS